MPIVSQFYDIIISMFFNDIERDNLPHIHVRYAEYRCVFDFEGNMLSGEIPNKQRKLAEAWIEIRKEELITLWNLLQNGDRGFRIEPIK